MIIKNKKLKQEKYKMQKLKIKNILEENTIKKIYINNKKDFFIEKIYMKKQLVIKINNKITRRV